MLSSSERKEILVFFCADKEFKLINKNLYGMLKFSLFDQNLLSPYRKMGKNQDLANSLFLQMHKIALILTRHFSLSHTKPY